MEYTVRKMRDKYGNLKDEIDPIRGRYSYLPFQPASTNNNYIVVPDGKVFYMDVIEVKNVSSNDVTFHIEDDDGNVLSIEYPVAANEAKTIQYYCSGYTGKIHFIPSAYGTLVFKPSGYLDNED